MRWNTVLFDLDGTVTDPKEGITCAVAYALRQQGIIADPDTLTSFIGPPLHESFPELFGLTEEQTDFARRIMEHFDLASYFHRICGAQGEDRASARKGSVVADALHRSGTDGPAVMVGDRRFDVAGAHENGLPAIGVLYGYGGREELENAGADYLAADLHELKQLLLQE